MANKTSLNQLNLACIVLILTVLTSLVIAAGTRTHTRTRTRTHTQTRHRTATATLVKTSTPSKTTTPASTRTKTGTFTPPSTPSRSATITPPPTRTATKTPTITPPPTRTRSLSISPPPTRTPTPPPTPTVTRTITPPPTPTKTFTLTSTRAHSVSATASNTPPPTPTGTPKPTRSVSVAMTASMTMTPPTTPTRSTTLSNTIPLSATASEIPSATSSFSRSNTLSLSTSATITPPPTFTPSATETITPAPTPTPTATFTLSRTTSSSSSLTPTLSIVFTASGTASFSSSRTLTSTIPVSTSGTASFSSSRTPTSSITASTSGTGSLSQTHSSSLSLSSTSSMTASRTPPLTGTQSSSKSLSETASIAPSSTPSFTESAATMSPPITVSTSPTESQSWSHSISESQSMSLMSTVSLSEGMTASAGTTETLSLELTVSLSRSHTGLIKCPVFSNDAFRCTSHTCTYRSDDSCIAGNCSELSAIPSRCLEMGCHYNNSAAVACSVPPQCSDILNSVDCENTLLCKWNTTMNSCVTFLSDCVSFTTQAPCVAASCSWNADVGCFRQLFFSTLCSSLSANQPLCTAQGCVWLSSLCFPWDITCEQLPPDKCTELSDCFLNATTMQCNIVDLQALLAAAAAEPDTNSISWNVVSAQFNEEVFPDDDVTVYIYGANYYTTALLPVAEGGDGINASVYWVNRSEGCPATVEAFWHWSQETEVNQSVSNTSWFTFVQPSFQSYDTEFSRNSFQQILRYPGTYYLCLQVNNTAMVDFSEMFLHQLQVQYFLPKLKSCDVSPISPSANTYFEVEITGQYLDFAKYGWYTVIPWNHETERIAMSSTPTLNSSATCPPIRSGLYSPVLRASEYGNSVLSQSALNTSGKYTFCYANRAKAPVQCPNYFTVQDLPIWANLTRQKEIVSGCNNTLTTEELQQRAVSTASPVPRVSLTKYNDMYCKSKLMELDSSMYEGDTSSTSDMVDTQRHSGIMLHPQTMTLRIGDGARPYEGNESCTMLIYPQEQAYYPSPKGKVIMVSLSNGLLSDGDILKVYVPNGTATDQLSSLEGGKNNQAFLCSLATTMKQCDAIFCVWNAQKAQCEKNFVEMQSNHLECPPDDLPFYKLLRVFSLDSFRKWKTAAFGVGLLADDVCGILVSLCSNAVNNVGLGAVISYSVQDTFCLNDCKDTSSTVRGKCVMDKEALRYQCQCDFGFRGADCSMPITCRGVGLAAMTLRSSHLQNSFFPVDQSEYDAVADEQKSSFTNKCAFQFIVEPPSLQPQRRFLKYGIGIAIHHAVLQRKASGSSATSCGEGSSYVLVRKNDYKGEKVLHLCADGRDLVSAKVSTNPIITDLAHAESNPEVYENEVFRRLFEDTTSVYVEYNGIFRDEVEFEGRIVSLLCPGTTNSSGYAAVDCDGYGECLKQDFSLPKDMPSTARECVCRSPYSATVIGETCDTCGFGYRQDTFPNCTSALICALGCSGQGACVQDTGCLCGPGWYGLDCQHKDDGERLKSERFLTTRLPLNGKSAGNAIRSGGFDRTLIQCALLGKNIQCKDANRTRGRIYAQQEYAPPLLTTRHRSSHGTENGEILFTADSDNAILINYYSDASTADQVSYPDVIRMDNVSTKPENEKFGGEEIEGAISIGCWVFLSRNSNGFLVAQVDTAFFPDGRSRALEKAVGDIQERQRPIDRLKLFQEPIDVYFALFANGKKKRFDLLVTNPQNRRIRKVSTPSTTTSVEDEDHYIVPGGAKEEWLYVRHFRLASHAGKVFEEKVWRHIGFRMYKRNQRIEGQIFIDGETIPADPDFVQCVPFLPVSSATMMMSGDAIKANNDTFLAKTVQWKMEKLRNEPRISYYQPGEVSLLVGYRLVGGLDELHIYKKSLTHRSIAFDGGQEFLDALFVSPSVLWTLIILCLISVIGVNLIYSPIKHQKQKKKKSQDTEEEEEEEGENEKEEGQKGPDERRSTMDVYSHPSSSKLKERKRRTTEVRVIDFFDDNDFEKTEHGAEYHTLVKKQSTLLLDLEELEEDEEGSTNLTSEENMKTVSELTPPLPLSGLMENSSGIQESGSFNEEGSILALSNISMQLQDWKKRAQDRLEEMEVAEEASFMSTPRSASLNCSTPRFRRAGVSPRRSPRIVDFVMQFQKQQQDHPMTPRHASESTTPQKYEPEEEVEELPLPSSFHIFSKSRRRTIAPTDMQEEEVLEAEQENRIEKRTRSFGISHDEKDIAKVEKEGVLAISVEELPCGINSEMGSEVSGEGNTTVVHHPSPKNEREEKAAGQQEKEEKRKQSNEGKEDEAMIIFHDPTSILEEDEGDNEKRFADPEFVNYSKKDRLTILATFEALQGLELDVIMSDDKPEQQEHNKYLQQGNEVPEGEEMDDEVENWESEEQIIQRKKKEEKEEKKKKKKKRQERDTVYGGEVGNVSMSLTTSWQVVGQFSSVSSFPDQWTRWFSAFSFIIALDFFTGWKNPPFHICAYVLNGLSAFCLIFLLYVDFVSRKKEHFNIHLLAQVLDQLIPEKKKSLCRGKVFNEKRSILFRLTYIFVVLSSMLYMPTAQYNLTAVFCHPNIGCLYDCYHEDLHMTLVYLGVVGLVVSGIGTPLLFGIKVSQAKKRYQDFVLKNENKTTTTASKEEGEEGGKQMEDKDKNDEDKKENGEGTIATIRAGTEAPPGDNDDEDDEEVNQELLIQYWSVYNVAVPSPFAGMYDVAKFNYAQFETVTILFRAVMCSIIFGLNAESLEQLAAVVALQILFTSFCGLTLPYLSPIGNTSLIIGNSFAIMIMSLRGTQVLYPSEDRVGWVMVGLALVALTAQLILLSMAVVKYLRYRIRRRRALDKCEVAKIPEE